MSNKKMAKPPKGIEKEAHFLGALQAFFFFTQRYVIVFYAVLGFATVFALFVSLVSIFLVLFSLISGGGLSKEFEFMLLVWIFFGIGLQTIMAVFSIGFSLWELMSGHYDEKDEFPETLERMWIVKTYFASTGNVFAKIFTFILPAIAVTGVLVIPLFGLVMLFTSAIEFKEAPPDLIRGIFIPALFLVGTSVFLINYNFWTHLKNLKN